MSNSSDLYKGRIDQLVQMCPLGKEASDVSPYLIEEQRKQWCRQVARWTEDILKDTSHEPAAKDMMNWYIRRLKPGERAREIYDDLYGILVQGYELIREHGDQHKRLVGRVFADIHSQAVKSVSASAGRATQHGSKQRRGAASGSQQRMKNTRGTKSRPPNKSISEDLSMAQLADKYFGSSHTLRELRPDEFANCAIGEIKHRLEDPLRVDLRYFPQVLSMDIDPIVNIHVRDLWEGLVLLDEYYEKAGCYQKELTEYEERRDNAVHVLCPDLQEALSMAPPVRPEAWIWLGINLLASSDPPRGQVFESLSLLFQRGMAIRIGYEKDYLQLLRNALTDVRHIVVPSGEPAGMPNKEYSIKLSQWKKSKSRNLMQDLHQDEFREGVLIRSKRHGSNQPKELRRSLKEQHDLPDIAAAIVRVKGKKGTYKLAIPYGKIDYDGPKT